MYVACFLFAHLVSSAAASSLVYFQFDAPVPSSFAQHRAARLTSCTLLYCLLRVLLLTAILLWLYYILLFTAAMSLYHISKLLYWCVVCYSYACCLFSLVSVYYCVSILYCDAVSLLILARFYFLLFIFLFSCTDR